MSDHLERLEALEAGVHVAREARGFVFADRADLVALCAECRRLRADVAAFGEIFGRDLCEEGGHYAAGVKHGAARQLAEACEALCGGCRSGPAAVEKVPGYWWHNDVSCAADKLRRLGPVRPPPPAERLEAENAKLRDLLVILRAVNLSLTDGGDRIDTPTGKEWVRRVMADVDALVGPVTGQSVHRDGSPQPLPA